MGAVDISGVEMTPVAQGEDWLEAEVSTPHGEAHVRLNFTEVKIVVTSTLPGGQTFQGVIDNWATGELGTEEEGMREQIRLVAAFVMQCFDSVRPN